jgi:hypothetical protein
MKKIIVLGVLFVFSSVSLSFADVQATVASKYDVNFYGFIKAMAEYESGQSYLEGYNIYTQSASRDGEQFRITAKETRFGFDIKADEKINGKFEVDFYGNAAGTGNDLRIRHAFINWNVNDKFSLLFGQYWHLTPLEFPGSNSPSVFAAAGCLWMRIPQIRATYKFNDKTEAAIAVTRGTIRLVDSPGTNAGRPGVQGHVIQKVGPTQFTLMGGFSKWRNPGNVDQYGDMWVVDLGYRIPVSIFTLNGQVWTGQNLYDFVGLVFPNFGYDNNEIRSYGGFANLKVKPWKTVWFNTAFGQENIYDTNRTPSVATTGVAATTWPIKNQKIFGNVNFLVYNKVEITLEAGPTTTWWKTASGATDRRQLMRYAFTAKFPF